MSDNIALVIIIPTVILGIVGMMLLGTKMNNDTVRLRNEAVVRCVEAGKPPLECKSALNP